MTPEIGHLALLLALSAALIQGTLPLWGAQSRDTRLMALAKPAAACQFILLALSFLCLTGAFIDNDFSVAYVANNSNSQLPLAYRIAAVWGGHEGSILLWALILAGWSLAVALFSQSLPLALSSRTLAVMGLISSGFLLFILFTSNPFDRSLPFFPLDGRDLNPLLQDFGLIIHPPMLYMGYVGFAVAFAFVVAALLEGRLDSTWARWSRPWTLAAWGFLTLGIALGSWWAYYELGWGGWWFWDPVENASFMPWLAGTALIHSLAATEKRGVFRLWTVILSISAFGLSLLGTFLVRSGVLTSVHAFANDPDRGLAILLLLALIVGTALVLMMLRANQIRSTGTFQPVSRETSLLANNLLLMTGCLVVFLGTLYPLLADVLGMGKISVGPPYFNALFVPLMMVLMVLLGIGPLLNWKSHDLAKWRNSLITLAILSIVVAWFMLWLFATVHWGACLGLALVFWVLFTTLLDIRQKTRHKATFGQALRQTSPSWQGMVIGHLGFAVCVTGIALSSTFSVEKDLRMAVGQQVTVAGYQFTLTGLENVSGPNFTATRATIPVFRNGKPVTVLMPEKKFYSVSKNVMTEVALSPGLTRDLYVALGEPLTDDAWAVRVHVKPFVRWIWLGGLFMALGGLRVITDRRYRLFRRSRVQVAHA